MKLSDNNMGNDMRILAKNGSKSFTNIQGFEH